MRKSDMAKKAKKPRNASKLSTLDDFLRADGKLNKFKAVAIKEALPRTSTLPER